MDRLAIRPTWKTNVVMDNKAAWNTRIILCTQHERSSRTKFGSSSTPLYFSYTSPRSATLIRGSHSHTKRKGRIHDNIKYRPTNVSIVPTPNSGSTSRTLAWSCHVSNCRLECGVLAKPFRRGSTTRFQETRTKRMDGSTTCCVHHWTSGGDGQNMVLPTIITNVKNSLCRNVPTRSWSMFARFHTRRKMTPLLRVLRTRNGPELSKRSSFTVWYRYTRGFSNFKFQKWKTFDSQLEFLKISIACQKLG
jgi:hypothetical protein